MSTFHDADIYRSILESLPTGLRLVDMEQKIVLWSDGAERITGYLRHEAIGHSELGSALLHCERPECEGCNEACPISRAVKTSQTAEATGFLRHKSGHEVPIRVRVVPVHDAQGSIIGAAEIFETQSETASPDHHEDGLKLPACVDEVTSIASPALMQSHLREALGTFEEVHVPSSILLLRLEGLKHFRANFGPDAAASLLRVVARTLENALWRTDFAGRWADDQFLVILTGCSEEALPTVCDRVRRLLASDGIEWWGEQRSLPLSVGRATAQPGDTIESLLSRAQQSLNESAAATGHDRAAAQRSSQASSGSQ